MTHLIEEVADHGDAVLGVVDLGVILHAVEATLLVGNGHVGAGVGVGSKGKALRHLGHIVAVAHPGDALLRQSPEELTGGIVVGLGLAVLPGGVILGLGDLTAQSMGHELAAVADTQNGYTPGKDLRIHVGRCLQVDAVGAAGKDDADGVHGLQLRQRGGVGLYFTVHIALPDPAGDQLVILAAEIQNDHSLMGHNNFLSYAGRFAQVLHIFYSLFLVPVRRKGYTETMQKKGGNRMDFHWDASADLEDLIYENQDVSASER